MTLEDYSKYYIQGSDHYLISKDEFVELFNEMINWKEESKQLKDNWNKLKDFISKEYYMYLPLEASTKSITILIDKMHELEQESDSDE